jgi:signal transduction histidine kinase
VGHPAGRLGDLHRNRITYWLLAGVFIAAGDILFFSGLRLMGGGLHAAGALITAYVVVTHRLPDVRQAVRRSLSYLIITLVTMSLYTAGFMAMQYAFQAVPGYSPLLAGAAMSLILAVLFQPLLGLTERMVNQLLSGIAYDSSQTLHQYSTNISNILDLELLANLMVKLIGEALKIRHGQLFLVDQHTEPDGSRGFRLRQIGSQVAREVPEGGSGDADKKDRAETRLAGESPIAEYLRHEPDPLTQYDVDLLPRYQAVGAEERAWFSGLRSDVYVPIHAKGEWIGLLALGPKLSGDRYFDEDLVLLRTLADQTAVALENARLVEDLIHAHNELGQAYAALARANRQLQELDKLKSAFIGVITHELRTPFANITFSLELLQRHGRKHLPVELSEQLDQLTAGVKSARTMVDNLVTFATFLSKQGELRPGEMDFRQVVEDSLAPLTPLAESKGIGLHAELPETLPSLCGDRQRLADAMYHLVHNALKFTNAGGQVWVRCRAVNHSLRFEVEDTGKGVPADKLPDLWEGFTQMADPLRRGVEGLGLGLALVKYVVNAHGGQVWADSQEGAGSTFGFQIPLAGPAGALPQLPPSPAAMPPDLLP